MCCTDEPSNDLDVDTLRSLEEALAEFAGSAIVVSHDRFFLDRVCSHTLAFESPERVEFFEGTVSDYVRAHLWVMPRLRPLPATNAAVPGSIPVYAGPLEGEDGENITNGV